MNCALWLDKHKVFSADEIASHLDIAALRGYFLAGSLVGWLRENNGSDYADALEGLDKDSPDLNERLAQIFGGAVPEQRTEKSDNNMPVIARACGSYQNVGSYNTGSFAPWKAEWLYKGGSFTAGSMRYNALGGSYNFGSYKGFRGSFHEWEWEWFFRRRGSFSGSLSGSFRGAFGAGSFVNGGSFAYGSFNGSALWETIKALGSYRGFPMGSFIVGSDEYDLIMYACLANCPLNRYGYGIHNI